MKIKTGHQNLLHGGDFLCNINEFEKIKFSGHQLSWARQTW